MEDIYVYEFDADRKLRVVTHAERGRQSAGEWHLQGLTQSRLDADGVSRAQMDAAVWTNIGLEPELGLQ